MSRHSQANLLLDNRYTRTVFLQHVIGDSTTLDARRFRALGREFQFFEGITHEAAGQQEEQGVVDYQILLGPERKNCGKKVPQCSEPGESHVEQIVLIGTKGSLARLCRQGEGNVVVAEVAQQSHLG